MTLHFSHLTIIQSNLRDSSAKKSWSFYDQIHQNYETHRFQQDKIFHLKVFESAIISNSSDFPGCSFDFSRQNILENESRSTCSSYKRKMAKPKSSYYRRWKLFGPILQLYDFFQKCSRIPKSLKIRQRALFDLLYNLRQKHLGVREKVSFLILRPLVHFRHYFCCSKLLFVFY